MKQSANNIGSIIENMVRKSGMSITTFAERIGCVRKNVYDIFKRNDISIDLLAKISQVLGHNFFEDVSKDYNLASPTITDPAEEERRMAVQQFLDVFPKIMRKLGYHGSITFGKDESEEKLPLPDFVLSPAFITFTIGETFEKRVNGALDGIMTFQTISENESNEILLCENLLNHTQHIDITLIYRTEEQWEDLFLFALSCADKYYNEITRYNIRQLMYGL